MDNYDYKYKIGNEINSEKCRLKIIRQYNKIESRVQKYKNSVWYDALCLNCNKVYKVSEAAIDSGKPIEICNFTAKTNEFKFEVGEKLIDDKRNFEVLDKYIILQYRGSGLLRTKHYLVKCHDCGRTYDKTESLLYNSNCGCQCNAPNDSIVFGYNDLYTLRPDLRKYFIDIEEMKQVRSSSVRYVKLKCPDCGRKKAMRVNTLTKDGFTCDYCSDGISYPNKFLYSFLTQLGVDYTSEYSPNWANNKRYDAEFNKSGQEYVVEMDGGFHYDTGRKGEISKNKLTETIKSDEEKNRLAKDNNAIMIRIPSYPQKRDVIKNSLENSLFKELFDLSKINWDQCDLFACSSLLVNVCNYYNENPGLPMEEYEKVFKIGHSAINKYLNKGYELGICNYYGVHKRALDRRKMIFDAINKDPDITTSELMKMTGIKYSALAKHIRYGREHGLIQWNDHNVKARRIENKVKEELNKNPNIKISKLAKMFGYSESGIKDVVRRVKRDEKPNLQVL